MSRSYFEAVWDAHVVESLPGGNDLLFIDTVVAHEITTPPGALRIEREFEGALFDTRRIVAVNDHVSPAKDTATAEQARYLRTWAKQHGIALYDIGDNGICHVLVPERGLVHPGMTLACGDSHTCTLGAFGAIAVGVGTTAQAGAMLSGCLFINRPSVMNVQLDGALMAASAKDLALEVVATLGAAGARGYAIEFTGTAVDRLSMDERMTLCNMSIEAGATTAIIRPDATTQRYLAERGVDTTPLERWFNYDEPAEYDVALRIDATQIRPRVTWGTNPAESVQLGGDVPGFASEAALEYMGLKSWDCLSELAIDQVFIGSCTNSRIDDLRMAAQLLQGRRVAVPTIITPGSQAVKRAAEREGLHDVFQDAGALWTHSSCGPCLGMSMGVLAPGMRCVSTSNRNFPGRMGAGGRVHLASPAVAAASAVLGHLPSESELNEMLGLVACA